MCSPAERNGSTSSARSMISSVAGCNAVPRASWWGASLRSTMRARTPWRRSSHAANSPAGPPPHDQHGWVGVNCANLIRKGGHRHSRVSDHFRYMAAKEYAICRCSSPNIGGRHRRSASAMQARVPNERGSFRKSDDASDTPHHPGI
jgi:hypothetical protein